MGTTYPGEFYFSTQGGYTPLEDKGLVSSYLIFPTEFRVSASHILIDLLFI